MNIFNFNDSRRFLRDYISGLPKNGRGEARKIAAHLGVSTTLISQVLAEQKSFTSEQAQSLIRYLGLSELEADYFMNLVQLERAGSSDVRRYWQSKLQEIKTRGNRIKPDRVLSDQGRSTFYSSPLYSVVRLYTSTSKNGKSVGEVAERFQISIARATEILRFLSETGLCTEKNDRYTMGAQSTHVERNSPHLLKHHSNWRVRAIRRSEDISEKELMYTAPVSLSEDDFAQLRESMLEFIESFLKTVHASPAEEVACFNMDFFWVKN